MQGLQSNWLYDVMNDFATFIKDIQGLSDLVGLLNQIKSIDFSNIGNSQTLLYTIKRLLLDSRPDDLIDSFNALLQNFGQLSLDNITVDIFADVQMLTKGLLGLQTIRSLIISNFEIADLIKDQDEFKTFLIKDLGLSETVIDAVLDGALSFEMLLNSSRVDVSQEVCNSTELEKLILLNNSRVDVRNISEAFCSLDRETIVNLTEAIIVRLDIGDLVEEMITKGFTSFLTNAGVTPNESKESIGKITAAHSDFMIMLNVLDNQTSIKTDFITALAEAQTEDAALSALLCGRGDSDNFFNLNAAIGNDASSLTDNQVDEMMNLPGEFCRDLYKDIMKTEGGPIIWGYLKPIIRGKILYTPDTPITKKIMQKINDTFEMLNSMHMTAKKWAVGSESLTNLYGSKEDQDQLKNFLFFFFLFDQLSVSRLPCSKITNFHLDSMVTDTPISPAVPPSSPSHLLPLSNSTIDECGTLYVSSTDMKENIPSY
ncbi:hypothetical protein CHS0354_023689 [Potamilus streckersoni]|uniref:Uncharacterized protein n=1 Tax=Potamilus streckersoni TaxID=2493646 RepID=A0AAE0VSF4_9BIVA|nr:hypothetical protein CHS0354_023689 [Potamilus streckersoni]